MRLFTVNIVEKYDAKIQQNEWSRKMANASKIVRQCTNLMRCKKTHINMRKSSAGKHKLLCAPSAHTRHLTSCDGAAVALEMAFFEHRGWHQICCGLTTHYRIELFKFEVFNYIA